MSQVRQKLPAGDDERTRPSRGSKVTAWTWFWATLAISVLLGGGVLYVASRSGGSAASPPSTEAPENERDMPIEASTSESVDPAEPASATTTGEPASVTTGPVSGVLLGVYVVDSFGFHQMEEDYAEATEVGGRDAGRVANVIAAVDAVEWPDQLSGVAATFRADLGGLHTALASGDVEGTRHGLEAVHGSQHSFSTGVYTWLSGTETNDLGGADVVDSPGVIEIEMVEFAYRPGTIDIRAGVPVILRFTNNGKLPHEAMVGDAHMQEEFAAAGDHDDGHGDDGGHHGDLMAAMVQPGETQDLEVLIDEPGAWFMACHLIGHYEAGQIATINVRA